MYVILISNMSPKGENRRLTISSLRPLLDELERNHHHIYALWMSNSVTAVAIRTIEGKILALADAVNGKSIDVDTPIALIFNARQFETEEALTIDRINQMYESYIYTCCESGLRNNEPLSLTSALIEQYNLTEEDVAIITGHIEAMSAMIMRRLQQEYDDLKKLRFIKR